MIERVPDLALDKKTYYETLFIFIFFALNVTIESGVNMAFKIYGKSFETNSEKRSFEAAYIIVSLFYLLSYLCYLNIL